MMVFEMQEGRETTADAMRDDSIYLDVCHHCAVRTLCSFWTLCSKSGQAAQRPAIAQHFRAICCAVLSVQIPIFCCD
jgi:hypothetical protein